MDTMRLLSRFWIIARIPIGIRVNFLEYSRFPQLWALGSERKDNYTKDGEQRRSDFHVVLTIIRCYANMFIW